MTARWVVVLAAFGVSVVVTRLSIPIARRFSLVDDPGFAKVHRETTPRFGGLGIVTSVSVCGIAAGLLGLFEGLGLLVIAATGALDDRYTLSPAQKLLGQAAGAVLLAVAATRSFGIVAGLVAFVAVMILSNGVNVIDGLNGLAGGVAFVAACGLAWLAHRLGGSAQLPLIVAAASAGFLVWNFPKARTFMGDIGSLSLGYLLTLLLVKLRAAGWWELSAGALILAIPVYDLFVGFVRRWRRGEPLRGPDREHFYDKLSTLTGSAFQTVLIVLGAAVALAATGALVGSAQVAAIITAWVLVIIAGVVAAVKLDAV